MDSSIHRLFRQNLERSLTKCLQENLEDSLLDVDGLIVVTVSGFESPLILKLRDNQEVIHNHSRKYVFPSCHSASQSVCDHYTDTTTNVPSHYNRKVFKNDALTYNSRRSPELSESRDYYLVNLASSRVRKSQCQSSTDSYRHKTKAPRKQSIPLLGKNKPDDVDRIESSANDTYSKNTNPTLFSLSPINNTVTENTLVRNIVNQDASQIEKSQSAYLDIEQSPEDSTDMTLSLNTRNDGGKFNSFVNSSHVSPKHCAVDDNTDQICETLTYDNAATVSHTSTTMKITDKAVPSSSKGHNAGLITDDSATFGSATDPAVSFIDLKSDLNNVPEPVTPNKDLLTQKSSEFFPNDNDYVDITALPSDPLFERRSSNSNQNKAATTNDLFSMAASVNNISWSSHTVGNRRLVCTSCGLTFGNRFRLKRHIVEVCALRNNPDHLVYRCLYCRRRAPALRRLIIHYRSWGGFPCRKRLKSNDYKHPIEGIDFDRIPQSEPKEDIRKLTLRDPVTNEELHIPTVFRDELDAVCEICNDFYGMPADVRKHQKSSCGRKALSSSIPLQHQHSYQNSNNDSDSTSEKHFSSSSQDNEHRESQLSNSRQEIEIHLERGENSAFNIGSTATDISLFGIDDIENSEEIHHQNKIGVKSTFSLKQSSNRDDPDVNLPSDNIQIDDNN